MARLRLKAVLRQLRDLSADPHPGEQDGALLRAFLDSKDQAAFEALVQRHGPMVQRVCLRTLGHVQDAEDAFQATFLVLAQQARSIRKKGSLASWLHGVAYRMASHAKRDAARRRDYESRVRPSEPSDPMRSAAWQEIQELLDREIARLPTTLRAAFICCCLENLSRAEAARQLGVKEETVGMRVSRARKLLQKRLARWGVSLPTVLAATVVGTSDGFAGLPPALLQAAAQLAAGQTLEGGLVPTNTMSLVQGVNRAMKLTRWKTLLLLLATSVLLGTGLGLAVLHAAGTSATPPPDRVVREGREEQPQPPAQVSEKPQDSGLLKVRGQVLDPDGKPLPGAKLYLWYYRPKPGQDPVRATSAGDGRFEFTFARSELENSGLVDISFGVTAVAEGYGCESAMVNSAESVILRLVKDVPIRGRILDPAGKPVAGAKLTPRDSVGVPRGNDLGTAIETARKGTGVTLLARAIPLPGPLPVVTTDSDGRFRFAGAGRERLVTFHLEGPGIASADLHVMTRETAPVGDGGMRFYGASFEFVAAPARLIRGVVRDKDTGKPLAGVSVGIGHHLGPSWISVTDKEGRYELLGLARLPQYMLQLKPADGQPYFQRSALLDDKPGPAPLTADFEMVSGSTVRGRVLDKATGKPIGQAQVQYRPLLGNPNIDRIAGRWRPRSEATTGSDGSYRLVVLPGPGMIGVVGSRPDEYMRAWVTLQERRDFFKTPLSRQDASEGHLLAAVGTDRFSWDTLAQDTYNAIALIEPGEKIEAPVKDVLLERAQHWQGRVVGPDGQALPGVTVWGLHPNRAGGVRLRDAEFTVRGINPRASRYLVFYHKDKQLGLYLRELPAAAPESWTVKLQPCGSASGRLLDPSGQPAVGSRIEVTGWPSRAYSDGNSAFVTTDAAGRFAALGLVPGMEYQLLGRRGRQLQTLARVVIEPGQHKDLGDVKPQLRPFPPPRAQQRSGTPRTRQPASPR